MVGKVGKLDFNTDSRARGRFARMVVNVSLDKLLVSQVLINGPLQRIEYEYLPTVCFSCGCYGHMKELCSSKVIIPGADFEGKSSGKGDQTIISAPVGKESTDANDAYGPWMLVERRSRCNSRDARKISAENLRNLAGKSRFNVLDSLNETENFQGETREGDLNNSTNQAGNFISLNLVGANKAPFR
ncbi:hypothetical protein PVK06_028001 [Gossypium arboreum]|uniref:CCHC-type domain-containing protein n=1 Tax=Gossypium arboreum TaxID=29729 RepID=A0ABR0P1S6_GOSAR|nr:hypothetical protein PVK06_028001 [Gossypium arboreum]